MYIHIFRSYVNSSVKYLLTLFILLKIGVSVYSQGVDKYVVTRSTSIVYSSIASTGSSIGSWRNSGTFSQDDNRSYTNDIGFDFWYNGTRYSQFSVSTNGFIDFSSSTSDGTGTGAYGYTNAAFYGDGSGTWLSIAPFYDDMTAEGGTGALGNSIKYLVSGSAPNRVLTVEWINMAVYLNTAPDLDFQLKLYETTGVIEFVYDTMSTGGASFNYTCGINAVTLNNAPTIAQLKCQQTANSTTFNNGQVGNLATLPTSQSKITFTPPTTTPGSPSGSVTFTGITSTGMTLNWTDWCSNELGYAIYNSTDGTNYTFVSQTAASATTYAATGLLPSTLYYWKVFAVKEGYVSAAVTGSQITNAPGAKMSNKATGNWNTAADWTPAGVPSAADNVTIKNGHTYTINTNAVCNNLTVGEGASGILTIGNNGTIRNITVNANLTIYNGASFITNTASDATHTISMEGDVINNGIINFRSDANSLCNATFAKNGNQTVSGAGTTNSFNLITVNMGSSVNNTLEFTSTNFSAPTNFLTLTMGTFKLSTSGTVNITPYSGAVTISGNNAFEINSSTATVNFAGGINLAGSLSISNGTLNIGNASDENLQSLGGNFQILGGTTNIAGRYFTPDINNAAYFSMSAGTLILPTVGSTSTTIAPFHINSTGSTFAMSNGTIQLQREGGGGAQDLGFLLSNLTSNSITGGTLQIGNPSTPAAQIIGYASTYNIGSMSVNSANATAKLNQNTNILNNVTISSGTFNANNFNLSLGGNFTNNGTFTAGTGTVTFNGSSTQTIAGSASTAFSNLTINNTSGVNISSGSYSLSDVLTLSNGTFSTNGNNFTMLSSASKTARIAPVTGTGAVSGDFIIERYIASRGTLTWVNLSSPVVNTTVQDWDDELFFYYPHNPPAGISNVLAYNEAISDYVGVTSGTTITPGMGFEIYLTDDAALTTFSNTTINSIGEPNTGTQNIPLSYTSANAPYDGENLIGNPFASGIIVNQMIPTNALANVDVFDNLTENYITLSGTDVIAPHQGFWAYATANGAQLSIPESAKSTSLTTEVRSTEVKPFMQLSISSATEINTWSHTLKFAAHADALDGFDVLDHPFRRSPNKKAPYITSASDKMPLVINMFNSNNESYSIPLNTFVGIAGKYQISISGMEFIVGNYPCVLLEDKTNGKWIDLNVVTSFTFLAAPNDNQNRFVLHFSKLENCKAFSLNANNTVDEMVQMVQNQGAFTLHFNYSTNTNVHISITNLLGQEIIHPISMEVTNQAIHVDLPSNYHGVYLININTPQGQIFKKHIEL